MTKMIALIASIGRDVFDAPSRGLARKPFQFKVMLVGCVALPLAMATPCFGDLFAFRNVGYAENVFNANSFGVAVSNGYAYVANDQDGLRVYNISNPTNPVAVGHANNGGNAR